MATNLSSINFNNVVKRISSFFASYYQAMIILVLIALIVFGLYICYTLTYTSVFVQKPIDSSIIQSQQEKINLQRYEQTSKKLEDKQNNNTSVTSIPSLFNN